MMPQRTTFASGGPDPRKILGLAMAGLTIYAVAKGRKVSPLAAASAVLAIVSFMK
jgi:hypothetical protein